MRIIWDGSLLNMYPLGLPGFRGGTENMIGELVPRLAKMGHTVHLVTRDLETEEQRGPTEWWWPSAYHPMEADVVIETQQVLDPARFPMANYQAPVFVLSHTGCDPYLGPENQWAEAVDAWPVFSEAHARLLLEQRPAIPADRVHVVGLGVNLEDYIDEGHEWSQFMKRVPGRMLYANDPMRGLFYVLDIFDLVRAKVPEATLHVAYDFDRQFAVHQWEHTYKGQLSWEMKRRLETTPGVVNLGNLSREQLIREQLECQVHVMPSDPPNIGTQTHGILQMECAAAGCALVLSDVEALPEVFGEAATILPVIGNYIPTIERRISAADYAEVTIELMKDPAKWQEASQKARALAEKHTWDRCAQRWHEMLEELSFTSDYTAKVQHALDQAGIMRPSKEFLEAVKEKGKG